MEPKHVVVALRVLALVASASACTSCTPSASSPPERAPPGADAGEDASTPEVEVAEACENARLYLVVRPDQSCAEIAGAGGTWSARPAFPDAPPEVQRFACAYRWTTTSAAPPDTRALEAALPAEAAYAPVCSNEPSFAPATPEVAQIERVSIPIGLAGSVGCDVCGFVWQDRLWAIISPTEVSLRELEIPLVGQTTKRAFRLAPSRVRAVVVTLPPSAAPYVQGRVTLY